MALAVVVVLVVVFWAVLAMLLRQGRAEHAQEKASLARINALSEQEAVTAAMARLADGTVFRCKPATAAGSMAVPGIPASVGEFFAKFDSVESVKGPQARIASELVSASEGDDDTFVIGEGMVASDVEFQLVVRRGRDQVFEVHAGQPIDEEFGVYSTVWHWVLAIAAEAESRAEGSAR